MSLSQPTIYRYISHQIQNISDDPHAQNLLQDAKALGFTELINLECHNIYFIKGHLNKEDQNKLASHLFIDSITQTGYWDDDSIQSSGQTIEIVLHPGVTDTIAEQIVRGAHQLGISNVEAAASGQQFILHATETLSPSKLNLLAKRLFANPVIHYYSLNKLKNVFAESSALSEVSIQTISLRNLSESELLKLSHQRRAALDNTEMLAIQHYFINENRDPTDVEFEMIAQTWSEHCSHKTFRANIQTQDHETIPGLLNTFIRKATDEIAAPWVYSAFVDNAGIIEFDDEYQISFKVETHNHPSAIEPFGGANTGVGGVIRDILGVSAKPIATTDIFCFGPDDLPHEDLPEGTLHPRLIRRGVIAGVQDYGNKTGIPTVNGAIWTDAAYTANPLVYCGCVGIIPKNKHPRNPQIHDRIILIGGRTGRDGLRGATFSSMTMDAQTGEVAGASVQIGDPIIARGLIEVITRACDQQLYHAITDCGAGGLSSAVGEMASQLGANVDISEVKLKYAGLAPWELWLSEAQERMVLAVPVKNIPTLEKICQTFDIDMIDIGEFLDTQKLIVYYQHQKIIELSNAFLHHGLPKQTLKSHSTISNDLLHSNITYLPTTKHKLSTPQNCSNILLELLCHPNIASKEKVIRLYDHEVQGASVVKPLTGLHQDGPSDACILKPLYTQGTKGIVLSNGLNPELGKKNAYAMAVSVIDEAIRNAVAVGADPSRIAILDNFCWGNPKRPETLGALVDACKGCYTAALHYKTPFISGKDSLNNEYADKKNQRHAIPGTLLISAIGIIPNINNAITMDFKAPGHCIYLLGETKPHFAGSHYSLLEYQTEIGADHSPELPLDAPFIYQGLHHAIQLQLVSACHDLSEGGLSVALAEMCIAGRQGTEIDIHILSDNDITTILFSESNGRLLVEVPPEKCEAFEACFDFQHKTVSNKLLHKIGHVKASERLIIRQHQHNIIDVTLDHLINAFKNSTHEKQDLKK